MQLESVERAIRRAHKRAEHEARQMALAETAKAERRHERRLMQLRRAEREAILTYELFAYDLEPCDLPESAWREIESHKRADCGVDA